MHMQTVRINKFSQVARQKVKTQKSVVFLHSNKQSKKKINNT